MDDLPDEAHRRRAIAWATNLAGNTSLASSVYEQLLLERYARGEFTLTQVLDHLDSHVLHVLYYSEVQPPFSYCHLFELLERARAWNQAHGLTGLLCYSEGRVIQVLEGDATTVNELYAKIRQDSRHHHVTTLRVVADPERFFAEWPLAFVEAKPEELEWVLTQFQALDNLLETFSFTSQEPHLLTLLTTFRQS